MTTREIYEWLCSAPMLAGEKVNLDYLPTYDGWSMTMPRRQLGGRGDQHHAAEKHLRQ